MVVLLAGIPVPDRLVLDLAARLRAQAVIGTAETLEDAFDAQRDVAGLTIDDREAILRALEDCPYGLADLRTVLQLEHEWRQSVGLIGHAPPVA